MHVDLNKGLKLMRERKYRYFAHGIFVDMIINTRQNQKLKI
jgi:glycerol-3-phosphate responsive antiterminator